MQKSPIKETYILQKSLTILRSLLIVLHKLCIFVDMYVYIYIYRYVYFMNMHTYKIYIPIYVYVSQDMQAARELSTGYTLEKYVYICSMYCIEHMCIYTRLGGGRVSVICSVCP